MSTSAQEFSGETPRLERRFYSRIVPHAPIYLVIDGSADSLLLNVSENGLLVSAPVALSLNFVARIDVPLTGLPKPVQVNVRVVWTNEINKQAGIQLLDLSEHDREQIRKWGSRETSQFLHPHTNHSAAAPALPTKPSAAAPAAFSPAQLMRSSSTRSTPANKPPVVTRSVSRTDAPEITTSPAARVALWGMAIAALCLAALFLLKNNALGNSFAHSREILHRSSGPIPASVRQTPAIPQDPDASTSNGATEAATTVATPPPLESAEKTNHVPAGRSSPRNSSPAAGGSSPAKDVASDEETSTNSDVDSDEDQLATPVSEPQPSAPSSATPRPDADRRAKTQIAPPMSIPNSTANNSASKPDSASKSSANPSNSSAAGAANAATRFAPPASPIANPPPRSPASSNVVAGRTPAAPPAKPTTVLSGPSAAHNVVAPVIQMDTPARQVMEIRLQRGFRDTFVNLPGERVLESPSATIRIQRSVRMPAGHSVLPLNPLHPFGRSKKVEIGGLMSRVDPQLAEAQIGPGEFIRVVGSVNENGQVESVKPIRGRANLVPAVMKAVQEWRYQPTLIDGKPAETKCDVLIEFHSAPGYNARQ
jgi:hypothetical protein